MPQRILRSACVGIAALAIAALVIGFVGFSLAVMATPSQDTGNEVGWDVLALIKGLPPWVWLFPVAIFAIGFGIGYRYFSKRDAKQTASI
jgi:ABC-type proline/glycine betaine transport system permease subunit